MSYHIEVVDPHKLWSDTEHLRQNAKVNVFLGERFAQIYRSIEKYGYVPSYCDIINIVVEDGEVTYLEGHKRLAAIHLLDEQSVIAVAVSDKPIQSLRIDGRGFRVESRLKDMNKLTEYPHFEAGYHPVKWLPHLTTQQAREECSRILDTLIDETHPEKHPNILDIGPFFGYFGFELAERGANVSMVEVDERNYEACQYIKRLYGFRDNPRIVHGNIVDYDVSGYDYVLLLNVYHYIYDQNREKALQLMERLTDAKAVYLSVNHEMLGLQTQDEVPEWVKQNTPFTECVNLGVGRVNKREGERHIYKLSKR